MGRTPQEDAQIKHRRTQVEELYLKGWTQAAIAGEQGVSQATISSDLKALRHEWSKSRIRNCDEVRDEELKKSDSLLREAWHGWQRSQEPAETTQIIQHNGEKKAVKTIRKRPGDPRFLQAVQRAIEARCKLRGLNAVAASPVDERAVLVTAVPMCVDFIQGMFTSDGWFTGPPPEALESDDKMIIQCVAEAARAAAAERDELESFDYEKHVEKARSAHEELKSKYGPST